MDYKIKINGEGTSQEIVSALKRLISTIEETTRTHRQEIGNVEWEDETLLTEINENI